MHFPPSLEEVTVSVNDERMWVRNHVDEHGTLVFSMSTGKILLDTSSIVKYYNAVNFCFERVKPANSYLLQPKVV